MNRHLYRVIFNKKRGMQMVVADIAKTPIGSEQTSSTEKQSSLKSLFVTLRPITFLISISLGFVSISSPVYGSNIVADKHAHKHQQPLVTSAANGTTQVNIQTPNRKGVSHNKYQQFDVSKQGVILNNSSKISQTQIGGYVQGNELLNASGSAKIILNEVNSRNPSQLNGVVEVAGQKAQVVIANPSGITCNGCGFINASRGTLTTGKPLIENGDLLGYQVEQGHIAVTGKGLDSSGQRYTDLIARTVSINSSVWAKDLNVVTGRNKVSRDGQHITALSGQTDDKPEVSIDVSALGGMYAGKIN
ncbi:two-partner secretion domain-containing protein, partial [Gilliamella sp. ESL0250]|uniref:two-partner secretion domain-containing protein n=1 Tax=Gilliamella sp. ESL0250 TaxID=2705036 RepID=UPI001580D7B5